jgi:competence protein ComEC
MESSGALDTLDTMVDASAEALVTGAWLVAAVITLSAQRLALEPGPPRWVVWNVGQGLWTTEIRPEGCTHIDAGGERWPRRALRRSCRGPQRFFLSHEDWDHIGGLSWIRSWAPRACVDARPGPKLSVRKKTLLATFARCPPNRDRALREIAAGSGKSANSRSRVWLLRERFLLPGDSPTTRERQWLRRLPLAGSLRVLVLGHHGSRTSTSAELLNSLPAVRMGIASARSARYGHPHREVVARLQRARIALVRTEDWGHLVFELPREGQKKSPEPKGAGDF